MKINVEINKTTKLTFGELKVGEYFIFNEGGDDLVCCKTYLKQDVYGDGDNINAFIINMSDLAYFEDSEEVIRIKTLNVGVGI